MPTVDSDTALEAFLKGDADAVAVVVTDWGPSMLRLARSHVASEATAEEVVQETWLAIIRGVAGFEGRASFRTWVYTVLVNTARRRGTRDAREAGLNPVEDPERFQREGDPWERHWTPDGAPQPWEADPAQDVLRGEVRTVVAQALAELPERQRIVVQLRDVEGWSGDEVCAVLDLTPQNQRVLLHRGRAKVRAALEGWYRS